MKKIKEENDHIKTESTQINKKSKKVAEENDALKAQNTALSVKNNNLRDIEKDFERTQEKMSDLKEQVKRARASEDDVRKDLSLLKAEMRALTAAHTTTTEELETAKSELVNAYTSNQKLVTSNKLVTKELEDAKNLLRSKEETLDALAAAALSSSVSVDTADDDKPASQKDLQHIKAKLKDVLARNEALKEELRGTRLELKGAVREGEAMNTKVAAAQRAVEKHEGFVRDIEEDLKASREDLGAFDVELKSLQQLIKESCKHSYNSLNSHISFVPYLISFNLLCTQTAAALR